MSVVAKDERPPTAGLLSHRQARSYAWTEVRRRDRPRLHDERAAAATQTVDRAFHSTVAQFTGGLSPFALSTAYFDWLVHLAASPGKQAELVQKAQRKAVKYLAYLSRCVADPQREDCCIEPLPQDRRFTGDAWRRWPFCALAQGFLLVQQWWSNATTGVPGVSRQHERVLEFAARQALDVLSPTNFLATNPEILHTTIAQGGANLIRGWFNYLDDVSRTVQGRPLAGAETLVVGRDVAATPGKVVFRNRLIELIQYAPTTAQVRAEPILIIPAWIMKYYVLDLSPHNSLVKYLIDQGFTVFMISWRNPDESDRDLSLNDYRRIGMMAALDAVGKIVPGSGVHAVGYCLGGTLLAIAAAAMARDGDDRLKTISMLAAQADFTEAGELTLFINESQIAFLEDMMWRQGYLRANQMAGAFHLLRSNDLIWSRLEREYLLGERRPMTDLMIWNADATRLPYRMHSDYLRKLFLNNDLAAARLEVDGRPVALSDIRAPIFAVGTTHDHVAPWRSVYKIRLLSDTDVTFLLTAGGHNAGILSEPGHSGRSYRIGHAAAIDGHLDPDAWLAETDEIDGSWWPEWTVWLRDRSGEVVTPPPVRSAEQETNAPLADAPGSYVHLK